MTGIDTHFNGNVLAAVDIETSGLVPGEDEVVEIAIVPLDKYYKPHPEIVPFEAIIKPEEPERFRNKKLLTGMTVWEICEAGHDKWTVVELLTDWFERAGLAEKKRFIPLGHNYLQFDMPFLKDLLCPMTYDYIFHFHTRDTMQLALSINDMCAAMNEPIMFPKVGQQYIAAQLRITNERPHRALSDALTCAEIYRRIITEVGTNLASHYRLYAPRPADAQEIAEGRLPEPESNQLTEHS